MLKEGQEQDGFLDITDTLREIPEDHLRTIRGCAGIDEDLMGFDLESIRTLLSLMPEEEKVLEDFARGGRAALVAGTLRHCLHTGLIKMWLYANMRFKDELKEAFSKFERR